MPRLKNLITAAAVITLTFSVASIAKAVILIDPGPDQSSVQELTFTVMPGDIENNAFHVVFDHMKHLELTQLTTIDILMPPAGTVPFTGTFFLTDEFHEPIGGTSRRFAAQPGVRTAIIDPPFDQVIFHDFHFEFDLTPPLPGAPFDVSIFFDPERSAVVGLWRPIPEPGAFAIFGLGLAGFGFIRRRRTA